MIRIAWLWTITVAILCFEATAQDKPAEPAPDPLAVFHQNAEARTKEWEASAKSLEARIARMLPCDPKARGAIEDVSHLSETRLAAMGQYLNAAAAKATEDLEVAKRILGIQAAMAGQWNTESTEAQQESIAIDGKLADLAESVKRRAAFVDAQGLLTQLLEMTKDRAARADERASRKDALNTLLGNLVVSYQDRRTAIDAEVSALEAEAARWSAYYTARLARSQTECAITNPGGRKKK
jgi:hypothetical protein